MIRIEFTEEQIVDLNYDDFGSFKTAISDVINTDNPNTKKRLKSLMTLKFQSFKKVQFLAE